MNNTDRMAVYLGNNRAITRTIWGHKIFVDTRDLALTPHILLDGFWEAWITKVFVTRLRTGMTVVEVGSNFGYYSLLAAANVGSSGKVYCFEANPAVAEMLTDTLTINGFLDRCKVDNKAVYSKSGQLQFGCQPRFVAGSSLGYAGAGGSVTTIEVEGISLDEYLSDGTRVDLLKIDAEGSELEIIRGARRVLTQNPDINLIIEYSPRLLSKVSGSGAAEVLADELASMGFRAFRITTESTLEPRTRDQLLSLVHDELLITRHDSP